MSLHSKKSKNGFLKKISSQYYGATIVNIALIVFLVFSFTMNAFMISNIKHVLGIKSSLSIAKATSFFSSVSSDNFSASGDVSKDAINFVISKGTPAIYGEELGLSFDNVQQSMNVLTKFDPDYGSKPIKLTGDKFEQYKKIGTQIACEYCCGAKGLIFKDGKAACGCAHSQAMRGLLAYLINNHDGEYTQDQKLKELARWKGMFFPKQMIKKLSQQLQGSKEFTPDTASLVAGIKLPDYGSGSKSAPLPSELKNLPDMVGGC